MATALGGSPAESEGGAPAGGDSGATVEPVCPLGVVGDWELAYFPELRAPTTQESHPFFKVTKRGAPTTLNHIALRYYFTKESPLPETAACYWVTGDRCALAKLEFGDVVPPAPNATRYLQVSFPAASDVTLGTEAFEVRVGFKTGSAPLFQSNDYSFDPDATTSSNAKPFPYKSWPRTTLYVDGALVWGAEPCVSGSRASRSTP
jgi:hypothetical protein